MIQGVIRTNFYRPGARDRPEAAAARDSRAARASSGVRDLRLLAADGGRSSALWPSARRSALVRPCRGFPYRGPWLGQGPDGEEHRDRPSGPRAASTAEVAGSKGSGRLAGRGSCVLPALHFQPAMSPTTSSTARWYLQSMSSDTTVMIPTWSLRRTKGPPPSPTWPTRSLSIRDFGLATRSPPEARPAMTTRPWALRLEAPKSVRRHFREMGRPAALRLHLRRDR